LEDSVKATILAKMSNSKRLKVTIKEVLVPCTMVMKAGVGGVTVEKQEKLLGGYVLIKMCMDKDTWYIIKNSGNVLNFVGHDRARRNASGGTRALSLSLSLSLALALSLARSLALALACPLLLPPPFLSLSLYLTHSLAQLHTLFLPLSLSVFPPPPLLPLQSLPTAEDCVT